MSDKCETTYSVDQVLLNCERAMEDAERAMIFFDLLEEQLSSAAWRSDNHREVTDALLQGAKRFVCSSHNRIRAEAIARFPANEDIYNILQY